MILYRFGRKHVNMICWFKILIDIFLLECQAKWGHRVLLVGYDGPKIHVLIKNIIHIMKSPEYKIRLL